MNNPLRYQITEYDCGPTSVLNGISALFPREVIPPDIPRYVMLYSLDGWGEDGVIGKTGTTATAMMFMSNWFNSYGRLGRIPISSHFYTGAQVNMREDGPVMEALHRGGVVRHQPQPAAVDEPLIQRQTVVKAVARLLPFQDGVSDQKQCESGIPDGGQEDVNRIPRLEQRAQHRDEQKGDPFFGVV